MQLCRVKSLEMERPLIRSPDQRPRRAPFSSTALAIKGIGLPIPDRTTSARGLHEPSRNPASLDPVGPAKQDPVTCHDKNRGARERGHAAARQGLARLLRRAGRPGPQFETSGRHAQADLCKGLVKQTCCGIVHRLVRRGGRWNSGCRVRWHRVGCRYPLFVGCRCRLLPGGWRRHVRGILDEPLRLGRFVNCQGGQQTPRLLR